MAEANTIFTLRMNLGDEAVREQSEQLSLKRRGKLMQNHPNQTRGLLSDD